MKLSEIYKKDNKKPVISIEIFPPKGDENDKNSFITKKNELLSELEIIKNLCNPSLVSVTYGAGGSNRENSSEIIKELIEKFNFDAIMPHFTCVCSSKDYIEKYLAEIKNIKIENILALRGDEPKNITVCYRDFTHAYELVNFIKQKTDFEIAVAGYPEGHVAAASLDDDIKNLKRKIECGGSVIFTQLFFENENFYKYLDILEKYKIDVPVTAGLLPVISYNGLMKMVELSGVKLPQKARNLFEKYKDNKEDTIKAGIEWTCCQAEDLINNGILGLHFYTLNKSRSIVEILKNINCNS